MMLMKHSLTFRPTGGFNEQSSLLMLYGLEKMVKGSHHRCELVFVSQCVLEYDYK